MDVSINGARILHTFENVPIFGTVQLTQTLLVSWLVVVIISALAIWLGSGLKVTGITRKQAVADLMTELAWGLVVFVLITYHKIKASGLGGYLKGFLDPIFVLLPINIMSECFTPVSMACRHFGNILSGTVISALVYAALVAANNALFNVLGSSLYVAIIVAVVGVALFFIGKKTGKKLALVVGIIAAILGVLAVFTNLGVNYPWLTIGIPAIPSLYFDWFGGAIQAFIFCTLTTLFIKQAAGE